jgi:hypothetical protein
MTMKLDPLGHLPLARAAVKLAEVDYVAMKRRFRVVLESTRVKGLASAAPFPTVFVPVLEVARDVEHVLAQVAKVFEHQPDLAYEAAIGLVVGMGLQVFHECLEFMTRAVF